MRQPAKVVLLPAGVCLLMALAALGFHLVPWPMPLWPDELGLDESDAPRLRKAIRDLALGWVRQGQMARPDGSVKTVDVGQLLIYAAQSHDRELYDELRRFCHEHLIVNDPRREETQGMVLWGWRPGQPPDASGTTEALRVAKGLWLGGAAFEREDDRAVAIDIVRAYCRHQAVVEGVWLIRNYYNLGDTRKPDHPWAHFVRNTYAVDYDPDFLMEVAAELGPEQDLLTEVTAEQARQGWARSIGEVAAKSYDLLAACRTPAGLIYDMVQPDIQRARPGDSVMFSPRDVVQMSNASEIAEMCLWRQRALGQGLMDFAKARRFGLRCYYYGRTGRVQSWRPPGYETHVRLCRLAVKLGDAEGREAFTGPTLIWAQRFAREPFEPRMHAAGEFLLTLQALSDHPARY